MLRLTNGMERSQRDPRRAFARLRNQALLLRSPVASTEQQVFCRLIVPEYVVCPPHMQYLSSC